MPTDFYGEDIMRKFSKDCKAGVHDQYQRDIKDKYYKECNAFWKDTQRRYDEEVSDSKKLTFDTQENNLMENLAIVRRKQTINDQARKRKHSSDNEDMKPASRP